MNIARNVETLATVNTHTSNFKRAINMQISLKYEKINS